MNVSIADLTTELVELTATLPAFLDKGFSVYDLDDLQSTAKDERLPIVGVAYEGGSFVDNQGNPVGAVKGGAGVYRARFAIIIAVSYDSALARDDTKPTATNLLDAIRSTVIGYKGVNTRPWQFGGEAPMPGEVEGVIFYGQIWETDTTVVSNQ